jgi:hypothetical protein
MTIKTSSVRWARWLLRVAVTCEALLAVGQAILMGGFLQGHYPLLAAHQVNATFTGIAAMPMTAAAVLQWRPRRWATPGQGQVVDRQMWFTKKSGVYDSGILTEEEFRQIRGKLGGLVLLDGEENASLGGKPLAEKLVDYARFNWLAASISPGSYGKGRANVKFRRFIQAEQLQDLFTPYQAGSPVGAYIDSRAKLYRTMAEHIWRPEELGLTVPGGFSGLDDAKPVERVEKGKTRTKHPTSIADLLNAGVLVPDEGLVGRRGGTEFKATILASGRIRTSSGVFGSPTGAAKAVRNAQSENGWTFWTVTRKNQTLDTLRQRYQAPS